MAEKCRACVLVGPGKIEIEKFDIPEVAEDSVCFKDVDIHGSWAYPALIFRDAISFLERTILPVEEVVTHVLPLDEFSKGVELTGSEGVGKVAITP
jgi:threonine dehydrogenase-like Zn-dependent dehydrogenase